MILKNSFIKVKLIFNIYTYLGYTIWWVLTNKYKHETITTMKKMNIISHPLTVAMPILVNALCSQVWLLPDKDLHWSSQFY